MKKLLSLIAILGTSLLAGGLHATQEPDHSARNQLLGAWKLVSNEEPDASGKLQKGDYTGTIVYTRERQMSVQIMPRNTGTTVNTGPVNYRSCDYEAYFGKFAVDERTQTVAHHVEGALVRTLIGSDLKRVYKFSGRQLILKSSRSDEHWTIVWEHF